MPNETQTACILIKEVKNCASYSTSICLDCFNTGLIGYSSL